MDEVAREPSGGASAADALDLVVLDAPIGRVLVAATQQGLVRVLVLGDRPAHRAMRGLSQRVCLPIAVDGSRVDEPARQIEQYLRGGRTTFDLPLDLRLASRRTRRVMGMLARTDYGATTTVRRLASEAGRPFEIRATAAALALNPLPIVVPSHRVVRGWRRDRAREDHPGGERVHRYLLDLEASVRRSRHAAWTGEHLRPETRDLFADLESELDDPR